MSDKSDPESGERSSRGGLREQGRVLFIDLVNPKFRSFNRPLLLAVLVGLVTLVLFGLVFNHMISDCEVLTFSGTPTQLAEVVDGGDVSCIHSIQKSYYVKGTGRMKGSMQSRECFFAPPITDTISDLNSARSDITENPFDAKSTTPITLEFIRDNIAAKWIAKIDATTTPTAAPTTNTTTNTTPEEDDDSEEEDHDALGYWMDLRGAWWSTETQDGSENAKYKTDDGSMVGRDGSKMTGGWIVPNHDKRPELKPLRKKDIYCKGSNIRNHFWGGGEKMRLYALDTEVGKATKIYVDSEIAEGTDANEIKQLKRAQELFEQKEFLDYTTAWTDKLRYRYKQQIPADFHPDLDADIRKELYYPFARWNEGDVWLDQCELITIEVDTRGLLMFSNEQTIHFPVGGMPTTTWRHLGLGYQNIRGVRKELAETTIAATYDLCPDFYTTFGSAMGWVVLLEAAATVLFLGLLMPCGIVKNDKAPFKAIISQVLSEGLKEFNEEEDDGKKDGKDKHGYKATTTNVLSTVVEMQDTFGE